MANEARSAELAITSLISNKGECNNCFKFLKKKRENPSEIAKKIDEGVML